MNMDRAIDGAPPNRERKCKKASGNRRAHSESPSCLSKKFAHKSKNLYSTTN